MPKAIALYSGGLDSTLAILVMLRLGVEVTAVRFLTNFGCDVSRRLKQPGPGSSPEASFPVEEHYIGDRFLDLVRNPRYGHGKNLNPCMDCKILMLKEAKRVMQERGFDFLITGEVLGQRPMSQRRDTLPCLEKDAGVRGLVLRPLSARLLKPTLPEDAGMIDRNSLYAFSGRSRKPQIALAKELGLDEYPQPAGGCLLTDPIYTVRLRDLLAHNPDPGVREIELLRLGRHFRVNEQCKIIVGRDERENEAIQRLAGPGRCLLLVQDAGSPVALVEGAASPETISLAASLCCRFSDARHRPQASVLVSDGEKSWTVTASSTPDIIVEAMRIHPPERNVDSVR